LVGFSQGLLKEAEAEKIEHNRRVLKEAKQALLQYAYNYPVTDDRGPGRLPCPDTDNDGIPNAPPTCTSFLGRLPWNQQNLNLYDIRDADGQRLWYVVSDNFSTQDAANLNSDTYGTITVRDQSGQIIYDGSSTLPKTGVAAVIIAPGAITARNGVLQDRSPGAEDPFDTTADTEPGIIDADNYLDQLGVTEDNANFTLGSAIDGFVLGPIDDGSGSIVINDQMIVITAAEVIEAAEKAVLQAYRTALQNYDQRIDNDVGVGDHYPWLFNYAVNDYGGGYPELDEYPSDPVFFDPDVAINSELERFLSNNGRIPSIFTSYFTETDGQPIESRLGIDLNLVYPISPATVGFAQPFDICPSNPAINCTTGTLDFDSVSSHVIDQVPTAPLRNVTFEDTTPADDIGRLTATVVANDTFSDVIFFWDEKPVGDGWIECGGGADHESDCNNDTGVNVPQGTHNTPVQVLRVQVDLNLPAAGVINFDLDYGPPAPVVTIVNEANGGEHAKISGTFLGANVDDTTLPVTVNYVYDDNYDASFDNQASGTMSLANLIQGGSLKLTLRYYPELPEWAIDNDWHDSVLMAYANNYRPDIAGACTDGVDCLQINNLTGNNDNKISLLAIAGQHDWDDGDAGGLTNDIGDVFDLENEDLDDTFDVRAANGNDKILVIDEL
jgi:hypothetical protein